MELNATTDLLAHADAKLVSEAGRSVSGLSRVEDCADVAALKAPARLPRDPKLRDAIDALEADLATARTLERAGRFKAAIAPATSALLAARKLHIRSLEADSLFELGSSTYRSGDAKPGIDKMQEAALAALAAGDDLRAGKAWASLVFFGDETGQLDHAAEWSRLGLAAAERLNNPPNLTAGLYNNAATLIDDQGKHMEAVALYEKSAAVAAEAHDDLGQAMADNNLAVTWATLGQDDKALPLYREAYKLWNGALGPTHPSTLMALENTAELLCRMGLLDEAEASVRRSIAVREKILGADNPDNWFAVGTLADIMFKRGRIGEAERLAEGQVRLLSTGFGTSSPRLMSAYLMLAEIYGKTNQPVRARAVLERAMQIDPRHDEVMGAGVRYQLALQLEKAGELRRAEKLVSEARTLLGNRSDARAGEEKRNVEAWLARHPNAAASR
jgi:tetratricopeptide (TPR) repeat protein